MPNRERERGISDVVAFVLTFSIIIFGVGIVSTGAFDSLVQFSDSQQITNSERGLEASAASLDNMNQNNDTYREFDVGVAGGTIFYNQTELDVRVPGEIDRTIRIDALEKRFQDEDIALTYEGGGVFRQPSARPRYQPKIRCGEDSRIGEDTVIISLINLTTDDTISETDVFNNDVAVSPTGVLEEAPLGANREVAQFAAELVEQNRTIVETGGTTVEIDVSGTAYPEQWGNYLDRSGWSNPSGDSYECGTDTVLVRITTVELSKIDDS